MKLAAFDLSLTSTGYALTDPATSGVLEPPKLRGVERLIWMRDRVLNAALGCDVVVIEGYAFARTNQAHQLGELGGVVRVALTEAWLRWVEVPPAVLKKYAVGRGNAGKAEVLTEAVRRLRYGGSSMDEADALWLLTLARDHYKLLPQPVVPKAQRAVLAKVKWPAA